LSFFDVDGWLEGMVAVDKRMATFRARFAVRRIPCSLRSAAGCSKAGHSLRSGLLVQNEPAVEPDLRVLELKVMREVWMFRIQ
jgi:hypothetical protein